MKHCKILYKKEEDGIVRKFLNSCIQLVKEIVSVRCAVLRASCQLAARRAAVRIFVADEFVIGTGRCSVWLPACISHPALGWTVDKRGEKGYNVPSEQAMR